MFLNLIPLLFIGGAIREPVRAGPGKVLGLTGCVVMPVYMRLSGRAVLFP